MSLVDVNNLWFNLPSGLGIGMHNAYSQVKQGFYSLVESSEEQAEITGVLVFRAEKTEQSFIEITDKLFKSKELNLVYIPYGDKEYYRQICITSIQKSEKRMNRFLECPVIFTALTPGRIDTVITLFYDRRNRDGKDMTTDTIIDIFRRFSRIALTLRSRGIIRRIYS